MSECPTEGSGHCCCPGRRPPPFRVLSFHLSDLLGPRATERASGGGRTAAAAGVNPSRTEGWSEELLPCRCRGLAGSLLAHAHDGWDWPTCITWEGKGLGTRRPQMRPLGMWRHPARTSAQRPAACVRPRANSDRWILNCNVATPVTERFFDPSSIRRRSRAGIHSHGGSWGRNVPRPIPACWSNSMRLLRYGDGDAWSWAHQCPPARRRTAITNWQSRPQRQKYVQYAHGS